MLESIRTGPMRRRNSHARHFVDGGCHQVHGRVFVGGKSRARCKIWIGGLVGGNEIAYAEGNTSLHSNSLNEALSLTEEGGTLALNAMMAMFGGRIIEGVDLHSLSADDAAEYLWRRFSSDLER